MKNLFFSVLSLVLMVSCTESVQETLPAPNEMEQAESNFVTLQEVEALSSAQQTTTRGGEKKKPKIKCIEVDPGNTVMYACDVDTGGWVVYSADARVPAIVAHSSTGTIEKAMQNEHGMA